jgi:hypothetical protein
MQVLMKDASVDEGCKCLGIHQDSFHGRQCILFELVPDAALLLPPPSLLPVPLPFIILRVKQAELKAAGGPPVKAEIIWEELEAESTKRFDWTPLIGLKDLPRKEPAPKAPTKRQREEAAAAEAAAQAAAAAAAAVADEMEEDEEEDAEEEEELPQPPLKKVAVAAPAAAVPAPVVATTTERKHKHKEGGEGSSHKKHKKKSKEEKEAKKHKKDKKKHKHVEA